MRDVAQLLGVTKVPRALPVGLHLVLALVMPKFGAGEHPPEESLRKNARDFGESVRQAARGIQEGFSGKPASNSGEGPHAPGTGSPPDASPPAPPVRPQASKRGGPFLGGLIVLGIGFILLAHNLGWTHWWNWSRYWPVLLMVIGMAMIFRRWKE